MDQVVAPFLPTTAEEFLAWEQLQEEKYEFDGQRPVAMNGGTWEHMRIELNIAGELQARLHGSSCWNASSTMKVAIGPAFRYPDGAVSCSPLPRGSMMVPAPVVLFEVVSPSSRTVDHVTKLAEYRSLPSVQRYVLVEQREVLLTIHARGPAGWTRHTLGGGDTLDMPEIGIGVPVDALYARVFPPS